MSFERVLVFAPDLLVARHFYEQALELQLVRGEEQSLRFKCANFEMDVFRCTSPADIAEYSQRAGSAVAFAVPNVERAMAELRQRGVQFLHASPNQAPDGTRYVAFTDPFGTCSNSSIRSVEDHDNVPLGLRAGFGVATVHWCNPAGQR